MDRKESQDLWETLVSLEPQVAKEKKVFLVLLEFE